MKNIWNSWMSRNPIESLLGVFYNFKSQLDQILILMRVIYPFLGIGLRFNSGVPKFYQKLLLMRFIYLVLCVGLWFNSGVPKVDQKFILMRYIYPFLCIDQRFNYGDSAKFVLRYPRGSKMHELYFKSEEEPKVNAY